MDGPAARSRAKGEPVTRSRHRRVVSSPSRDRWLLSYADFITLLFAFFAALYASSTVDAGKLSGVAAGLQHAFADQPAAKPSVLPAHTGIVGPGGRDLRA